MTRTRWHTWSWTAWMALFGFVCAPTLSHAVAAWQGNSAWIEVCSAQGTRRVQISPTGAPVANAAGDVAGDPTGEAVSPGAEPLHRLSHCPLCGLSGIGMAPAPLAPTGVARLTGRVDKPARPAASARTSAPAGKAQPRGPPVRA